MIVGFGDLHVNKDPLRILTVLNFLDYIIEYVKKNNIKNAVCLGDIFDTSNSIKNEAFVPIFLKFMELSKVCNLYIIPGNHDIQNKDNDCLAETFSAFAHFIKKSETINIDGIDYDFLGYTDNQLDIPNKGRVLFSHLEIEGFYYNPNRKIEGSMLTPEMFDQYSMVVSGHLHHKQESGIFNFVGSPFPTNKGEGGKKNYFAVIDGTSIKYEDYNNGPDYITINVDDFAKDIDYTNKIVTVKISKKVENFVKLRNILYTKGALVVSPEFEKEEETTFTSSKIDTSEGVIKSAAKYLKEIKNENIDNNLLLSCFKEVLKRNLT